MAESVRKTSWLGWSLALLLGLVLLRPDAGWAASFEFGGDNRIKVQDEGRIDPYYSYVDPKSAPGDAVTSLKVGMERLDLFAAMGVSQVTMGRTYSGFDYSFGQDVDFWLYGGKVNMSNPARNQEPSDYDFGGVIHLTSITFTDKWLIQIEGYLSGVTLSQTATSAVLKDLAQADRVNLSLTLAWGSKTEGKYGSFVNVLNSDGKSSWATLSGKVSGENLAAVPEPATAWLLASSLGLGAWIRRRRRGLPAA